MGSGIAVPCSPLIQFVLLSDQGGGGMAPCALLSYANDSGVARIFNGGQSERAKRPSGERVWRVERFLKFRVSKWHCLHFAQLMSLLGLCYV